MLYDTQNNLFNSSRRSVKRFTDNITNFLSRSFTPSKTLVHPCVIDGKSALVYEHGLKESDNISYQKLAEYAHEHGLILKEDQRRGQRSIRNDRTTRLIPLVFLGASMFSSYGFAKSDYQKNAPLNIDSGFHGISIENHIDAISADYDDSEKLMAGLVGWINEHTSYDYSTDILPDIKFSSSEEIATVAFGKNLPKAMDLKSLSIKGLYNYKESTVYLLDSIDINTEKGRAILLHELVHFLQYQHGQEKNVQCKNELEALAYTLEARYLEAQDVKVDFSKNHVHRVSQCS